MSWTRRDWMTGLGAGGVLASLPGCADWTRRFGAREQRLLQRGPRPLPIVQWRRQDPDYGSVLRQRGIAARRLPGATLRRLDARMRACLTKSGGVGLAAPQVGFARRVFLVQLQRPGKPVLTGVDPVFTWRSDQTVDGYEACLSVQGVGGLVRRSQAVDVVYYDVQGRRQQLRSTGWEARIFQHEMDHLDGVLYLDRLVGPLLPIDEVRRRRKRSARSVRGWRLAALDSRPEGPWVL